MSSSSDPLPIFDVHRSSRATPSLLIMVRFNAKVAVLFLTAIGICTLLALWTTCGLPPQHQTTLKINAFQDQQFVTSISDIPCRINTEYTVQCKRQNDEIFLPFSFIQKYFEIYGKIINADGVEKFVWSHSYSRIYRPKGTYDPKGVFMYFENYNVEVRDRVKCISGQSGVPISTQWQSQGYYYPTQIAQFGLSHYSKNLTDPEPRRTLLEDGDLRKADWLTPDGSSITRFFDNSIGNYIAQFEASENYLDNGVMLHIQNGADFVLAVDICFFSTNGSLTAVLKHRETQDLYHLHYIVSDGHLTVFDNNIYHGIGITSDWHHLTRDLIVDLHKGLLNRNKSSQKQISRIPKGKLQLESLIFRGSGAIDNLTISTTEHIRQFYAAADWLVQNQDRDTGGWPIAVHRRLGSGFKDLMPGWNSAMSQGHALSLLSRAYYHSQHDEKYLKTALLALKPFTVVSSQRSGVLTYFLDKYPWYEEYPTSPSSFVLNGFIYALLGLYDLWKIAPKNADLEQAKRLFEAGIESLKQMLLFYDMGSGTSYDLRHISLKIAPNLARWDYHATHINQLLLLDSILDEPVFRQTAERWIGYMNGKRASHN